MSPAIPSHGPVGDGELVQIVDAALRDATLRALRADGTSWLSCRPGCTPCCHGIFRISMLDAARLQQGLQALEAAEPARAAAIRERAESLCSVLTPTFAGDPESGLLDEDKERWDAFSDLPEADAACPVLDPATGRCELYTHRPLTCRVFGPPVLNEGGIGLCELCYIGATEDEILSGEMHLRHAELESQLDAELPGGETLITWAVRSARL